MSPAANGLSASARDQLDEIIARHRARPGALLTILERVQGSHESKYLPRPTLEYVVTSLGLPRSQAQSVATFYSFFNLEPQGVHTVAICRGTACHTRGSKELLDSLRKGLDFAPGDGDGEKVATTTRDGQVTLRTVACIGQCALAPVVEVDGAIHGHVSDHKLKRVMAQLVEEGEPVR
jgi:NADH-quinone oxidoreductase subunit E